MTYVASIIHHGDESVQVLNSDSERVSPSAMPSQGKAIPLLGQYHQNGTDLLPVPDGSICEGKEQGTD